MHALKRLYIDTSSTYTSAFLYPISFDLWVYGLRGERVYTLQWPYRSVVGFYCLSPFLRCIYCILCKQLLSSSFLIAGRKWRAPWLVSSPSLLHILFLLVFHCRCLCLFYPLSKSAVVVVFATSLLAFWLFGTVEEEEEEAKELYKPNGKYTHTQTLIKVFSVWSVILRGVYKYIENQFEIICERTREAHRKKKEGTETYTQ